jgi:hypothetical protein
MKVQPWALAVAIALVVPIDAQRIEKGSRDDLTNVQVVYVDVQNDSQIRAKLLAALAKELPAVRVAESEAEAQLVLRLSITSTPSALPRETGSETIPSGTPQDVVRPQPMGRAPARSMREPVRRGGGNAIDPMRDPYEGWNLETADDQPRVSTFVTGEALRPMGANTYRKAFEFVRRVGGRTRLLAVDDFVRSFAKAYRKANPAEKSRS